MFKKEEREAGQAGLFHIFPKVRFPIIGYDYSSTVV